MTWIAVGPIGAKNGDLVTMRGVESPDAELLPTEYFITDWRPKKGDRLQGHNRVRRETQREFEERVYPPPPTSRERVDRSDPVVVALIEVVGELVDPPLSYDEMADEVAAKL